MGLKDIAIGGLKSWLSNKGYEVTKKTPRKKTTTTRTTTATKRTTTRKTTATKTTTKPKATRKAGLMSATGYVKHKLPANVTNEEFLGAVRRWPRLNTLAHKYDDPKAWKVYLKDMDLIESWLRADGMSAKGYAAFERDLLNGTAAEKRQFVAWMKARPAKTKAYHPKTKADLVKKTTTTRLKQPKVNNTRLVNMAKYH